MSEIRCIHDWEINPLDPLCGAMQFRRWWRWRDFWETLSR